MEWMENLSDELKESKSLRDFKNVEELAKAFLYTKAMQGNSIRIHGPDASEQAVAENYQKIMKHFPHLVMKPDANNAEQSKEFHAMMGVPESVEGYSVDGINLPDDVLNNLRDGALVDNLSKAQWNSQVKRFVEMQGATNQQSEDARTRQSAELHTVWGLATPDRLAVVEKHLKDNPGLGDFANMSSEAMQAHYQMSRSLNGVKQMNQQPYVQDSQNTPEEAKAKMKEIMDNPVYFSSDPKDRFVQAEMRKKIPQLIRESNPS